MLYTISDLSRSYETSLRLIAGSSGLSRVVSGVAILDYELLPGLKNKYQRVNFAENEVVLSTFLYAKDNPHLITDAIKYLVSKGTSGLVIKNALHLSIPEQAIRYANVRNYPLFIVTSETLFFDDVIFQVRQHIFELSTIDYAQRQIDALLIETSTEAQKNRALRLNPSFLDELAVFFLDFNEPITPDEFVTVEQRFIRSPFNSCHHTLALYDGGIILIATANPEHGIDANSCERQLLELAERCDIAPTGFGQSEKGFGLESLARLIRQAIDACALSKKSSGSLTRYEELGLLRAILPFAESEEMKAYTNRIVEPLREFDAEHNAQLEKTLTTYASYGKSIEQTAKELQQHPNTVRYRLEQIGRITQLDYRTPQGAEQLCFACAVLQACKIKRAEG